MGVGQWQSTHQQHGHRRHRLIQRPWRSPTEHGCRCIRRLDGRLLSNHSRQRRLRENPHAALKEASSGSARVAERSSELSATACGKRSGRLTARASRTSDCVLGRGLLAGALERGFLAAGAFGLGSAGARLGRGALAAGGWDSHGLIWEGYGKLVSDFYLVVCS